MTVTTAQPTLYDPETLVPAAWVQTMTPPSEIRGQLAQTGPPDTMVTVAFRLAAASADLAVRCGRHGDQ